MFGAVLGFSHNPQLVLLQTFCDELLCQQVNWLDCFVCEILLLTHICGEKLFHTAEVNVVT